MKFLFTTLLFSYGIVSSSAIAKHTTSISTSTPNEKSSCTTSLDCSLNGLCVQSSCVCDAPWTGANCETLGYSSSTPTQAFDIYNQSDSHNTWSGPIFGPDLKGLYHGFLPLYEVGSLFKVITMMHGLAPTVTGPWNWTAFPNITNAAAINPAFLTYPDPQNGSSLIYSLWVGGQVHTTTDLYNEPFTVIPKFSYPFVNPAPIFHNNVFYFTNQHTQQILTTPSLEPGQTWTVFANISATAKPLPYHIEDPFMWIDKRGNWHIINHAYSETQTSACASSNVSSHFFSTDGKNWNWSDQPYQHLVTYADGSSHIFATLERPNIHFDTQTGEMTHVVFAADLETGDAGCGSKTACDNCKYSHHDGTTVVELVREA